jgi:hypothetical protein
MKQKRDCRGSGFGQPHQLSKCRLSGEKLVHDQQVDENIDKFFTNH